VKGISDGIQAFDRGYFHKIYQHLLW